MYDLRLTNLQLIYGLAGAREKFEELCIQLVKRKYKEENVRGVRVFKGDGGIDVKVGEWINEGVDIFQCKYFNEKIGDTQKGEIRDSYKKVVATVNEKNSKIKKWILCLPILLTNDEQRWFEDWKSKKTEVESIELWDADDIACELMKSENQFIYATFFKDKVEKPIVAPKFKAINKDYSSKCLICNYGNTSAFNVQLRATRQYSDGNNAYSRIVYLGQLLPREETADFSLKTEDKSVLCRNFLFRTVDTPNNNDKFIIEITYFDSYGNSFSTRTEVTLENIYSSGESDYKLETFII